MDDGGLVYMFLYTNDDVVAYIGLHVMLGNASLYVSTSTVANPQLELYSAKEVFNL